MPIRAILFDLDGTLVDSEGQTDLAIAQVMANRGVASASLPPYETRGRTWLDIARALLSRHALPLAEDALAQELANAWELLVDGVEPIPGAPRALAQAASRYALAVVSSSPRRLIDRLLARIGGSGHVPFESRVGAEDVERPKPHPDAFLLGARRCGVAPEECVVFEDSRAGLEAARGAGMGAVLVAHRCADTASCRPLAHLTIDHYEALPEGFWESLRRWPLAGAR